MSRIKMNYLRLAVASIICIACYKPDKSASQTINSNTITYKESKEDFPNPERGFYMYSETKSSDFKPISLSQLKTWKGLTKASEGNYSVYSTLLFRYYVLDSFKDKPLSTVFINAVKTDFDVARMAGFKVIPRFTYTNTANKGSCPEGFICPPYGDAPKDIVLQHIAQLKEVFFEKTDVIAAVQMGFIGVWGEQYYTDYFGDASQNASQLKLLDQNWKDRIEVVKALLDAVPKDRMVQVRYPQIKQRTIFGVDAPITAPYLTNEQAFSQTDQARLGYHNDCFLASPDDYGTFEDYGNSSTPRQSAIETLKAFKRQDSKYVVVGGETCDDTYSPQNDCEPAGIAQKEMSDLHYSYLNSAYNNQVNNDWQTGGCMDNIKKNLGYRFVLQKGTFPKNAQIGQFFTFQIDLRNVGYASCYNPRPVKLVLRHVDSGTQYFVPTDGDPRRWFPNEDTHWETSVALPDDMQKGKYKLFLFLPDKYESIASNPDYAIRLANENIWEAATGYNSLNVEIEVE